MPKVLLNTKCTRIAFHWDELSRYGIDTEVSLSFMEYVFNVKRAWIIKIIKGYVKYDKVDLAYPEIEKASVNVFVKKLFKTAQNNRSKKSMHR